MAVIIIRRKSSVLGGAQNHDVYIANTFVGNLKNGGVLQIPVNIGVHTLSFRSTMKKFGKNATFNVVVNEANEIVELRTKFSMNDRYEVEYADNKPHIPTGVNATYNQMQSVKTPSVQIENMPNAHVTGMRCPRCGSFNLVPMSEVSSKGKDFKAGDACCGYLMCGPIGLLCGATGKGKQISTVTYWLCRGCGNKFQA